MVADYIATAWGDATAHAVWPVCRLRRYRWQLRAWLFTPRAPSSASAGDAGRPADTWCFARWRDRAWGGAQPLHGRCRVTCVPWRPLGGVRRATRELL